MVKPVFFYLLIIALFQNSFLQAQDYYFKHYKAENGLSHNTVLCSLQDSKGFLWFGTKDGLNRFDGYNFKHYRKDTDNEKSLGSNFVECIHEYDNLILVGTDSGLYIYNDMDETFELIKISLNTPILDIESDNNGNIWFIGGSTLFKYNIKTKKSETYSSGSFRVEEITKTPNGDIWVAFQNTLYKYIKETNSFIKNEINLNTKYNQPIIITKIFPLNNDEIIIGTQNNGAVIFNNTSKKLKKIFLNTGKPVYVRDFIIKENRDLWIATESGLYIYDLADSTYVNLKKSYNNAYSLSDNAIYSLTVDKEDGVWIGTYFGGINYYPKQYTPFKKYFPKLGENSISGNAVREIHSDKYDNLWIGTEDAGLNKLNLKTGIFTNYLPTKGSKSLSYHNIHGLLIKDDKLLIGTFEHGLDIMDIKTGEIVDHYSTASKGNISSNFIFAFYENKKNEIFAITTSGIQLFDYKNRNFSTIKAFPEGYFYTTLLEDKNEILWAGTYWEGLFYFDPKTNSQRVYRHNSENPNSISSNAINGIFQDSKNNIWITTENGLNEYDPEKNEFKNYSTKDGLPSNVTYSILEDDRHFLWISTSKGLVEFNPDTKEIKTYTKANGLLSDQFNYHSAHKKEDGTMFFGGVEGMISFNPKDFITNRFKPPIFITNIEINSKDDKSNNSQSIANKSASSLDEIILKPDDLSLKIEFAALSFNAPEMTEYWYKLGGLNDDWIYLGKKHEVSFTGLAPGDYNFKIKSRNNNGIWSEESSELRIDVLPPFWKSNVAYTIYIMILILIAYFLLRIYHLRINEKNNQLIIELNRKKEKELYNAKIEFFTNISHEIRTPLTLIKSPLEKILKRTDYDLPLMDNLSIMDKNTTRLLDLVNQLLDFRKVELEGINLTFVEANISELIRNTYTRFSPAINNSKIDFMIDLMTEDTYAFVDVEALKKILSNLFSNAIKYADKVISISLVSNDDYIEFKIKNDGKIIPMHLKDKIFQPFFIVPEMDNGHKSSTGIGLSLAHSLVELHKGSLILDTSDPTMNCFVLKLPIHQINEFKLFNSKKSEGEKKDKKAESDSSKKDKPKILLVDDNEDLLDFLENDLAECYHVLKTTNAKLALNLLENENIQLIISDVMMPKMDGFVFCEKVKTNIETSHIPIILLTAKSSINAKVEGLESGADAYIEKPFSLDHLRAQINSLMLNRSNIIEHYSSSPLAHVKSIVHSKTDEIFIKKLDDAIYANISDSDLNVERLAEMMNMSKSTFYRKIKNLSNLSPNELINITRLKKAAEYLRTGNYKIYEIAEMVGYNSQITLLRNFQKQFNMTPSDYMNSSEKEP
ncbi:hybrid sensor histidine kinase/response regulator transcription factor [Yeosuana marina]|uniref:hybrid sensor histidine kinase/response regulator transcription factor n=1 Tax=Yeosuana marina TaxID=1565536 RepID=UPI0030C82AB3